MIGIYKVTNKINGKIYIGQSKNIKEKWTGHKNDSFCSEEKWKANKRHEQTHFHRALRKYGKQNFKWEIIEECKKEELAEKEKFWIKYYSSYGENGYNMTYGGDGCSLINSAESSNSKITQEECNFIKEKLKAHWTASEIIAIIPNATNGIISAINYGKSWFDPLEKYPISINNGHRTWTDEEALLIKEEYANGYSIQDLAEKYCVDRDTISNLINGKSYKNLPIIQRKVNYKKINKKRIFTNEQVKEYRKMVKEGKSMLSIFSNTDIPCGYAAFRNMIKGITYKDVEL